jgi:thiamine biosynthesis lipoprotein
MAEKGGVGCEGSRRDWLRNAAGLLWPGCLLARDEDAVDVELPAMATRFRVTCHGPKAKVDAVLQSCLKLLNELEASMSDYHPNTELMRLCAPGRKMPVAVSAPLFEVLESALQMAELSQGAFDPTCGHLTHLWRRAKRNGTLPPPQRLRQALDATDWKRVRLQRDGRLVWLEPGTLMDLGGIAKGDAAQRCVQRFREAGLAQVAVQAGGDTVLGQAPPGREGWEVRLRWSATQERALTVKEMAVSTSGDLHQFVELEGKRYSHILSPRDGLGLPVGRTASVIAPRGAVADALATAACVLGREEAQRMLGTQPGLQLLWP